MNKYILNLLELLINIAFLLGFVSLIAAFTIALMRPNIPLIWLELVDTNFIMIAKTSVLLLAISWVLSSLFMLADDVDEMIDPYTMGDGFFIGLFISKCDFILLFLFFICVALTLYIFTPWWLYSLNDYIQYTEGFSFREVFHEFIGPLLIALLMIFILFAIFSEIVLRIKKNNAFSSSAIYKYFNRQDSIKLIDIVIWLLVAAGLLIFVILFAVTLDRRLDVTVLWLIFASLYLQNYIIHHLINFTDEHKLAIENVREAERIRGKIITYVAHDFGTPITNVCGYAQHLKKASLQGEAAEYVDVIIRNSDRLKKLLEDVQEANESSLLTSDLNIEKVELTNLISEALKIYEDNFKQRNITIVATNIENSVHIRTDRYKLLRVLENLLGNAAKHSLPQTQVFIDVDVSRRGTFLTIKNTFESSGNENVEDYMQELYRGMNTKEGDGSGMGLTIAKGYMNRLGHIDLKVDKNIFEVRLKFDIDNPNVATIEALTQESLKEYVDPYEGQYIGTYWSQNKAECSYPASIFEHNNIPNIAEIKQWISQSWTKKVKSVSNLTQTTDDVIEETKHLFSDKEINLILKKQQEDDIFVYADKDDLRQMLVIILSNIAKYAVPRTNVFIVLVTTSTGMKGRFNGMPGIVIKWATINQADLDTDELIKQIITGEASKSNIVENLISLIRGKIRIFKSGDAFMLKVAISRSKK